MVERARELESEGRSGEEGTERGEEQRREERSRGAWQPRASVGMERCGSGASRRARWFATKIENEVEWDVRVSEILSTVIRIPTNPTI
jgi:hypothetical protein